MEISSTTNIKSLTDSLQLLKLTKKQSSLKPIRVCKCACIAQIEEKEKIIELQNEYTKALQLQNLRRNEERIYLQAEIKELKLYLQQPTKHKEQLLSQICHYKQQIDQLQVFSKTLQEKNESLNKSNNSLELELQSCKSENQKLKQNEQFHLNLNESLKNKLKEACVSINNKISKERKSSITVNAKKQENLQQVLDKIAAKWEQYAEQSKAKIHHEYLKELQKSQRQIDELQQKLKKAQDSKIKVQSQLQEEKTNCQNLQVQIHKLEDMIQSKEKEAKKLCQTYQRQAQKSDEVIEKLKNQLNSRQSWKSQNTEGKTSSKDLNVPSQFVQEIVRETFRQSISISSQTAIQDEQTETERCLRVKLQSKEEQITALSTKNDQLASQIQKFSLKLETLERKNELLREKIQELNNMSGQFPTSNQDSQLKKSGLNALVLDSLLKRHAESSAQLRQKMVKMEQLLEEKQKQIECLEESNSNLKKLRIESLNLNSKIQQLQSENYKLRKNLGASTQKSISNYRAARSQINRNFRSSNCSESSVSKGNLNKSQIIPGTTALEDSGSSLKSQRKQTLTNRSSHSSHKELFLDQFNEHEKHQQMIEGIRPKDRLKVRRNDTHESDKIRTTNSPCVSFSIQVPKTAPPEIQ